MEFTSKNREQLEAELLCKGSRSDSFRHVVEVLNFGGRFSRFGLRMPLPGVDEENVDLLVEAVRADSLLYSQDKRFIVEQLLNCHLIEGAYTPAQVMHRLGRVYELLAGGYVSSEEFTKDSRHTLTWRLGYLGMQTACVDDYRRYKPQIWTAAECYRWHKSGTALMAFMLLENLVCEDLLDSDVDIKAAVGWLPRFASIYRHQSQAIESFNKAATYLQKSKQTSSDVLLFLSKRIRDLVDYFTHPAKVEDANCFVARIDGRLSSSFKKAYQQISPDILTDGQIRVIEASRKCLPSSGILGRFFCKDLSYEALDDLVERRAEAGMKPYLFP